MSIAPAPVVDGIDRQPLPYGLFSVLTPRATTDAHWQNGVVWEALTCAPASGIGEPECDPETPVIGLPKSFAPGGEFGEAGAFTVYGSYVCNPVGHTISYAQDQATAHLLAREEARVEQALWTGDLGTASLADESDDQGTFATVTLAVARLEAWLGRAYGSVGVLHLARDLALIGVQTGALEIKGNRLFTALGTPVVAGAGYWTESGDPLIYATPALLGYRSEVFLGGSPAEALLDRSKNDLYAVAERTYVIGWDPCGTAVAQVTL